MKASIQLTPSDICVPEKYPILFKGIQQTPEMTELAKKDIKASTINILHMFMKVEENMSMSRRETEDTYNIYFISIYTNIFVHISE